MQSSMRRGQGATEYLVLLAIVLIICLVTVALLGFMPGMSYEARKTESQMYWTSSLPFQIPGQKVDSDSNELILFVTNTQPDAMLIENISISGTGLSGWLGAPVYLSGSEMKLINVTTTGISCSDGDRYEFDIIISYYNDDKKIAGTQYGTKRLVGQCLGAGSSGWVDDGDVSPPADPDPPEDDFCGGTGEECCVPGGTCHAGNVCRVGACEACGQFLQICCADNQCDTAIGCVFGTCI